MSLTVMLTGVLLATTLVSLAGVLLATTLVMLARPTLATTGLSGITSLTGITGTETKLFQLCWVDGTCNHTIKRSGRKLC